MDNRFDYGSILPGTILEDLWRRTGMGIALQLWGGIFYLLNKVFFSKAERATGATKRMYKTWAWIVYLIGLPAWLVILGAERDWMAVSVETGGSVSMVLGLVIARRGIEEAPEWLAWVARVTAVIGIGYSLYDFGGLTDLSQYLELGLVAGFLVGTYKLAKERPSGYLWFMLMNASCGILMFVQDKYFLGGQQALSLLFVVDAYVSTRRKSNTSEG